MYGIDRKFTRKTGRYKREGIRYKEKTEWVKPRMTFVKGETAYLFTPTLKDYFTPSLRGNYYESKSGRIDLGLGYNYRLFNFMFAPGITLLKKFLVYTGLGEEIVMFSMKNSYILNSYNYIESRKGPYFYLTNREKLFFKNKKDNFHYFESGVTFDIKPEIFSALKKKNIVLIYNYYFNKRNFHKIRFNLFFDFEFKDRSIYSTILDYKYIWFDPPLHHEASVTSSAFKGFMGIGYHSRNILSFSNEYKISIYRDFIYAGIYNDYTLFEGSGYDLPKRIHLGIVGGPTVRLIFLDQFEFYMYYGIHYLVPKQKTGDYCREENCPSFIRDKYFRKINCAKELNKMINFTFKIYKKW